MPVVYSNYHAIKDFSRPLFHVTLFALSLQFHIKAKTKKFIFKKYIDESAVHKVKVVLGILFFSNTDTHTWHTPPSM